MNPAQLNEIKAQQWFYEFTLPDGSLTESYLPDFVKQIHLTREKALCSFLNQYKTKYALQNAIDVSCHEGYYSHVLAHHFQNVVGVDKNHNSLKKAQLITDVLEKRNITFHHAAIEDWQGDAADFVLCFGLLYHIENPVQMIRKLAAITKSAICIESQILPAETIVQVEDGCYKKLRDIKGSFGLCFDYPEISEGGLTELALVPSREALMTLLHHFGFKNIQFYMPHENDYEQFVRQQRVIIYAEKNEN